MTEPSIYASVRSCSLVIVIVSQMFMAGCNPAKPRYEAEVTPVMSIGTDNPDSSAYLFGKIIDLKTDCHDNLYVLDGVLNSVKKFDSQGHILHEYHLAKGSGPGEFVRANQIAVDEYQRLYVTDLMLKRLSVFDSTGALITTLTMKLMPSQVVPSGDLRHAFVVGYLLSYQGPLIHCYDLVEGKFDTAFCERYPEAAMVARTGNSDRLVKAGDGSLYLSQHYPYRIIHLDATGNVLKTISRSVDFFEPPKQISEQIVESMSGNKGLTVINDTILVNVIFGKNAGYQMDFFSLSGEYLTNLKASSFGVDRIRYIGADSKGYVYLDAEATFPVIRKFAVHLNSKEKPGA